MRRARRLRGELIAPADGIRLALRTPGLVAV